VADRAGADQAGTDEASQSAVLLCVPEAEPLVGAWRSMGDPSAARGVPAHVTLLYPFLPAGALDEGVLGELEWFFAGVDAFGLQFEDLGQFEAEGVLYLRPRGEVLVELVRSLALRWPECPPYGGKHPDPTPHLTVVHSADHRLRQQACDKVAAGLPLRATARQASLWVCDADGTWSERATFDFGPEEQEEQ
jgi:hypothetical protein